MKVGFLGLGNMGQAIIKGIHQKNSDITIYGYDINPGYMKFCQENYQVIKCDSIKELVNNSSILVLAVKPQVLPSLVEEIQQAAGQDSCIISIAAGIDLNWLNTNLKELPIVRVMPNINAQIGCSTSCYCCNELVHLKQKKNVVELFELVGTIQEIPESQFSVFTAIAGSSPAITYLYLDSIARAALQAGMSKDIALKIIADSVIGSSKMVLESNLHPIALMDSVCSPNGTTIEGIQFLKNHAWEGILAQAIQEILEKEIKLSQKK